MINMRLFPLLRARLIFQEPVAGHTSGAIWKCENRTSSYGRHAEAVQNVYGPQAAGKRPHQCAETNIILDQLLNSLGSPGVFYSTFPLAVPQLRGGATNGHGETDWSGPQPLLLTSLHSYPHTLLSPGGVLFTVSRGIFTVLVLR